MGATGEKLRMARDDWGGGTGANGGRMKQGRDSERRPVGPPLEDQPRFGVKMRTAPLKQLYFI